MFNLDAGKTDLLHLEREENGATNVHLVEHSANVLFQAFIQTQAPGEFWPECNFSPEAFISWGGIGPGGWGHNPGMLHIQG